MASSWVRKKPGINSTEVPKPNLRSHTDQEPDHEFIFFYFELERFLGKKKILGFGYMLYPNSSKKKSKDAFNLDLDTSSCFIMLNSVREFIPDKTICKLKRKILQRACFIH